MLTQTDESAPTAAQCKAKAAYGAFYAAAGFIQAEYPFKLVPSQFEDEATGEEKIQVSLASEIPADQTPFCDIALKGYIIVAGAVTGLHQVESVRRTSNLSRPVDDMSFEELSAYTIFARQVGQFRYAARETILGMNPQKLAWYLAAHSYLSERPEHVFGRTQSVLSFNTQDGELPSKTDVAGQLMVTVRKHVMRAQNP